MNNINSAFLETKANNRLNALRLLFRQRIPFPHGNSQFSRNINSGSDIYSKRVFRKWSYHTV